MGLVAFLFFLAGMAGAESVITDPRQKEIYSPRDTSGLKPKRPPRDLSVCLLSPNPGGSGATDLERRLARCPALRRNIVWQEGNGTSITYENWPQGMKERLDIYFQGLFQSNGTNSLPGWNLDFCRQAKVNYEYLLDNKQLFFPRDRALTTYLVHVAHALYLEATDALPWKLFNRPDEEIQEILSSDRYFARIKPLPEGNYVPHGIMAGRDFQLLNEYRRSMSALCDPRVGHVLATQEGLIGENERDTLVRLSAWLHDFAVHGPDNIDYKDRTYLSTRVLKKSWQGSDYGYLAIGGCHGAASLLKDLARSVNIPLLHVESMENNFACQEWNSRTHGGLAWRWKSSDARYCWHMDDIYANLQFRDIFACSPSGTPVSKTERNELLFQAVWLPRAELEKWGFAFNLHKVTPGAGYDIGNQPQTKLFKQYYDLGFALGHWRPTVEQAQAYLAQGCAGLQQSVTWSRDNGFSDTISLQILCSCSHLGMHQRYGVVSGLQLVDYVEDALVNPLSSPIYRDFERLESVRIYGAPPPFRYWENPGFWHAKALQQFNATAACYGGVDALRVLQQEWNDRRRRAE
jgi:hypothetical protein